MHPTIGSGRENTAATQISSRHRRGVTLPALQTLGSNMVAYGWLEVSPPALDLPDFFAEDQLTTSGNMARIGASWRTDVEIYPP
jgi:hypothetical protein